MLLTTNLFNRSIQVNTLNGFILFYSFHYLYLMISLPLLQVNSMQIILCLLAIIILDKERSLIKAGDIVYRGTLTMMHIATAMIYHTFSCYIIGCSKSVLVQLPNSQALQYVLQSFTFAGQRVSNRGSFCFFGYY